MPTITFGRYRLVAIGSVFVLIAITLWAMPPYNAHNRFRAFTAQFPTHHAAGPPTSLEERVAQNEAYYQESLVGRRKLIEKYGPNPEDVEAFPQNYEPYTLWDFFIPAFQCPHRVERIGSRGDCGKWVCGMDRVAQKKSCVVYSFGINVDSSFEADILNRAPGCQVYGYDFSVNAFGLDVSASPVLSERAHFHPYALGGKDSNGPDDKYPTYTLRSLMEMNEHTFIDILKVDIEGGEFDALSAFLAPHVSSAEPLPFGQLQVEIHAWNKSFKEMLRFFEMLELVGLRPFWTEPNLVYVNMFRGKPDLAEYSFINIRGRHSIVADGDF